MTEKRTIGLYSCGGGKTYFTEDPCHDCHDVSCQYHQGFSDKSSVEIIQVTLDQQGVVLDPEGRFHKVKYDENGKLLSVTLK